MDNFILSSFDIGLTSYISDYFELVLYAVPNTGVSLEKASTAITETPVSLARVGVTDNTLERV